MSGDTPAGPAEVVQIMRSRFQVMEGEPTDACAIAFDVNDRRYAALLDPEARQTLIRMLLRLPDGEPTPPIHPQNGA